MLRELEATGKILCTGASSWCNQRMLCQPCSRSATMRNVSKLEGLLASYLGNHDHLPVLLTLTEPQGPELQERFAFLMEGIRKAAERRKKARQRGSASEFARIEGAAFFAEVKRGSRSGEWHPHLHGLVMLPRGTKFDMPGLWSEWASCLGVDHANVDARLTNLGRVMLRSGKRFEELSDKQREALLGDLLEVCKYSLKFSDMEPLDVVECYTTLKGKHLRRTWGSLRGILPDEDAGDELDDGKEPGRRFDHLAEWFRQEERYLVVKTWAAEPLS